MIKLDKNGNIIAYNGFNNAPYRPVSKYSRNVFLGEASKADLHVRDLENKRNYAENLQNRIEAKRKEVELERKMLVKNYMGMRNYQNQQADQARLDKKGTRSKLMAIQSGKILDAQVFMGSPFVGFGNQNEERYNPDSGKTLDIVEAGFQDVEGYGVNSWMEAQTSEYDNAISSLDSYTPGKEVMQTLVDYAVNPMRSMISVPSNNIPSPVQTTIDQATGKEVAVENVNPSYIKYGIYGLALYLLLK